MGAFSTITEAAAELAAGAGKRVISQLIERLEVTEMQAASLRMVDEGLAATRGSRWSGANGQYQLFQGDFALGDGVKADAFGGIVNAGGNSVVNARNDTLVVGQLKSTINAMDESIVRMPLNDMSDARVTLRDQSQYIDMNSAHSRAFENLIDERVQSAISGKIPISVSTKDRPFLYESELFDVDSRFAEQVMQLQDVTVRIEKTTKPGQPFLNGNGVALSDNTIATAAHIVPAEYDGLLRIRTAAGLMHEAEVTHADRAHDAMLLRTKTPMQISRFLELGTSTNLPAQSDIVMVGTAGSQRFPHSYPGRFIARQPKGLLLPDSPNPEVTQLKTTAFGHPGTSGSGIANLRTGKVIGFVHGGTPNAEEPINKYSSVPSPSLIGIPAEDFMRFLKR